MVYVLLESPASLPIAIFSDHDPALGDFLPMDAKLIKHNVKEVYSHRDVVKKWRSDYLGSYLMLIAYKVF